MTLANFLLAWAIFILAALVPKIFINSLIVKSKKQRKHD